MIETSGWVTWLVIIIFGGFLPVGLAWGAVIIVMGPRRYREWEQKQEKRRNTDGL